MSLPAAAAFPLVVGFAIGLQVLAWRQVCPRSTECYCTPCTTVQVRELYRESSAAPRCYQAVAPGPGPAQSS